MKVRTQLIIGFLVVVVLLSSITVFSINLLDNLNDQYGTIEEYIIPGTLAMNEVEKVAYDAYHEIMKYVLYDDASAQEAASAHLSRLQEIETRYFSYETTETEKFKLNQIMMVKIADLYSSFGILMDYKRRGATYEELLAIDRNTSLPALLALQQELGERKERYIKELALARTKLNQAHMSGVHTLYTNAGVVIFLAAIGLLITYRSIIRPLYTLRKGTEMIASGDLSFKVGTRARDEIGELSRAFDHMTESLSTSMTSIENLNKEIAERKQAEEALRESEERFSKAFRSSPETIAITTLKDGKFIEVNDSFTRLTGYTREETIGRSSTEMNIWANPNDRKKIPRILKKEGRVYNEEFDFRIKSGEIRNWLFSAEKINIHGEECLISVTTDITEIKLAVEALKESEEKYRAVVEKANIGIVLVQDFQVALINRYMLDMLGYTEGEHISSGLLSIVHPEDIDKAIETMKLKLSTPSGTEPLQIRVMTKSGEVKWIEINSVQIPLNGRPAIQAFILDITERKQAEEALAEEAIRRRILVEQSRDGIVVLEQDGQVYEANQRFAEMLGYTMDETLKLGVWDWEYLFPREQVAEMLATVDEAGDHFETKHRRKDGTVYDVEISTNAAVFAGQKLIFCVCRDITERKQAEEALRESEEKFSKAFQSSPEAITISILKDGKILDVNDSFTRLTGYTRDEVIGRTSTDINLWAGNKERANIAKILREKGRIYNEEFDFRVKSGKIHNCLFSAEKLNIHGKECMISIATDISKRKQAEAILKENEERFRLIAENSTELISRVQLVPEVRTDYTSPSCVRITGYQQEDFYNDPELGFKMIHPDDREFFLKHIQKENDNLHEPIVLRLIRKDGQIIWIEQTHTIITNENGEPVAQHLFARDITERKAADDALKQSEEKFSKAFRLSPQQIIITRTKDGKIIEINKSFTRVTGYTRRDAIRHAPSELNLWVNPQDQKRLGRVLKEKGRIYNEEITLRKKSGELITELTSAEKIELGGEECLLSILTDISERKRTEEALRESEEKFYKAFYASPDSMTISTVGDGTFLEVNDSYTRITGYSRDEVVGHNANDLDMWVNPEQQANMIQRLKNRIKIKNEEFDLRTKSGAVRTLLFSSEYIQLGGEACVLSVSTDITDRKRSEEELKLASARLAATNKELEAFSYSVSHDLRSPLRSIDGFSQALLEDYNDSLDDTGQDYLRRLRGASQKMGELIDGLLKLSRLTRSEMHLEDVDLSSLAEEIANRLQESQPKRKAQFLIDKGLTANGDPQLLRVLFENLLGNAWKFSGKKTRTRIEFGITENGNGSAYYVKDNGAGFDMTYSDKLFGAFQRLHNDTDFPGTGIGLATVQRIINRHGGSIWAESAEGKGTTFFFTLN